MLSLLCLRAGETNDAYPSVDWLADRCGVSTRAITARLSALEEKGYVVTGWRHGGRGKHTRWSMVYDAETLKSGAKNPEVPRKKPRSPAQETPKPDAPQAAETLTSAGEPDGSQPAFNPPEPGEERDSSVGSRMQRLEALRQTLQHDNPNEWSDERVESLFDKQEAWQKARG